MQSLPSFPGSAWERTFPRLCLAAVLPAAILIAALFCPAAEKPARKTEVSIVGPAFHINGKPTYAGRTWKGHKIEGLLLNSRMVQGIFDDLNPETVKLWAYPDTGKWDADRNTREFVVAMPAWREHGLLTFTIDLQGGSPQGYSKDQPWHNSAITPSGELRPEYMARLKLILDKADELGMVAILGIFYFGQDQRLSDEGAVKQAVDNSVDWVFDNGYRNVLIEINNECNVRYDHAILQPQRVHELIDRVKKRARDGRRLLVGTSYGGGKVSEENVVRSSDFLLMHGNGVKDPKRVAEMVRQARQVPGYRPMPILFNEDDHFDFDKPENNFTAALSEYASWGYFDFRMQGEKFDDGYQSVPVNWGISSPRKKAFFGLLKEITTKGGEKQVGVFPDNAREAQATHNANDIPAEFSGPQVGEKLAPLNMKTILGDEAGKEIDLVKSAAGKPVLIVFVHERNRPAVGLARLLGLYAATKKADGLTAGVVFLTPDATATEEWLKIAKGALPGGVPVGLSTDGQEGPGAYGLNRKVQMTILVGKDDKVTANFALVQPSVQADAPKIAQAIVDVLGGGKGPTIEELQKLGGPMRPGASPRRR